MRTYRLAEIVRVLRQKEITVFAARDFARLFNIGRPDTVYKKLARLEKQKIIQRLIKGRYCFALNPPDDFTTANFLYQPSYISLESALSFYGVITGFPHRIMSVTVKKTKTFVAAEKEYQYVQIGSRWFWGYEKKERFLIAEPEKAMIDYLYLASKGLRSADIDEFDLSVINRKKLDNYLRKEADKSLIKLAEKIL